MGNDGEILERYEDEYMNRKWLVIFVFGLLLLAVAGCTSKEKEPAADQKMETEEQVNKESTVTVVEEDSREDHIERLYQELKGQFPADLAGCEQDDVKKEGECKKPSSLNGDLKENINIQIILDSSKSMDQKLDGRMKMEIAQKEIARFASRFPKQANVSLRVYGHEGANDLALKEASCAATETIYPFQPYSKEEFKQTLSQIQPAGWTNIAKALEEAKEDFADYDSETNTNIIYLVTDGLETCGGDPAAAAAALGESGIEGVVNVIGFDVSESTESLKEIAAQGNGKYFDARNAEELQKIFEESFDWVAWTQYYNCIWLKETNYSNSVWIKEAEVANCKWVELTNQTTKIHAEVQFRKARKDEEAKAYGDEVIKRVRSENEALVKQIREQKDSIVNETWEERDKAVKDSRKEGEKNITP